MISSLVFLRSLVVGVHLVVDGGVDNPGKRIAVALQRDRDGEMGDIKVHIEPYSKNIAEEGLKWLAEIKEIVKNDSPAPAQEPTKAP